MLSHKVLGSCELFEERQVGNERFNIFSGCPSGQTATIVLRGGADQVCHFAIMHDWDLDMNVHVELKKLSLALFSSLRKLRGVYMMQL